ncbi:MAG: glycosyltransferase family 39 protein, partial [Chlamydiota bacterium]
MEPCLFRAWYYYSDEYVYAAEVIRFLHLDFHQHFFDQPGTPFMLVSAGIWSAGYWLQSVVGAIPAPLHLEDFTFSHLLGLFATMRAITLICFLISLALLFRLASRLINWAGACVACMILMMSPTYAGYSSFVRTESLAMCFLLAAVLVLLASFGPAERERPREKLVLIAGLLAGVAAGARLHSITLSLPLLLLLVWTLPASVYPADDPRLHRFCRAVLLAAFAAALALLLWHKSGHLAHTGLGGALFKLLPDVWSIIPWFLLAVMIFAAVAFAATCNATTRRIVVRLLNPAAVLIVGGCAVGFFVSTPTIFQQYRHFVQSAAMYSGTDKDWVHLNMPLMAHVLWYVKFSFHFLAPDKIVLALLALGAAGILISRERKLLIVLAIAASFFVSKPLNFNPASHHVILWLPFYAIICGYPVAKIFAEVDRRWQRTSLWSSVAVVLFLFVLWRGLTSGPRWVNADMQRSQKRMANIQAASDWVKRNTGPDATIAVAFFCHNPDIFYGYLRAQQVPEPSYVLDGRRYMGWFGAGSALQGRRGFACMTQSDRYYTKTLLDLRSKGGGTDPYLDPRFHLLKSFGAGPAEVDLFTFDFTSGTAQDTRTPAVTLKSKG